MALVTSVVPVFDETFGLEGRDFDELPAAFGVLGVPRKLFDELWSVLLFLHLLYIIQSSASSMASIIIYKVNQFFFSSSLFSVFSLVSLLLELLLLIWFID